MFRCSLNVDSGWDKKSRQKKKKNSSQLKKKRRFVKMQHPQPGPTYGYDTQQQQQQQQQQQHLSVGIPVSSGVRRSPPTSSPCFFYWPVCVSLADSTTTKKTDTTVRCAAVPVWGTAAVQLCSRWTTAATAGVGATWAGPFQPRRHRLDHRHPNRSAVRPSRL